MTYKPTGYGLGRPRKGEIRPITPTAKSKQKWIDKQKAIDLEGYKAHRRNIVAKCVARNPEKVKQQMHNAYLRSKAWKDVESKSDLTGLEILNEIKSLEA